MRRRLKSLSCLLHLQGCIKPVVLIPNPRFTPKERMHSTDCDDIPALEQESGTAPYRWARGSQACADAAESLASVRSYLRPAHFYTCTGLLMHLCSSLGYGLMSFITWLHRDHSYPLLLFKTLLKRSFFKEFFFTNIFQNFKPVF